MGSLDSVFKNMKSEGIMLPRLNRYLVDIQNEEENDRAIDVNAPSQIDVCMRARYYARKHEDAGGSSTVDARVQRIFDNGTYYHIRMQKYMSREGSLLMIEVPTLDEKSNSQGHTDGILNIGETIVRKKVTYFSELAVLELKSIKDQDFRNLIAPLEKHKKQAMIYLYCLESRRKYLRGKYRTYEDFSASESVRAEYAELFYQHLKDGKKYTREEKIAFQISLHIKSDDILYRTLNPITKMDFMYEDKNDQEIKEYIVEYDDSIMQLILKDYWQLNSYCTNNKTPDRPYRTKTEGAKECRYCKFSLECWRV